MQDVIKCRNCRKEITDFKELFMTTKSGEKLFYHKVCANRLGLGISEEIDIATLEAEFEEKRLKEIDFKKQQKEAEQQYQQHQREVKLQGQDERQQLEQILRIWSLLQLIILMGTELRNILILKV